MPRHILFCTSVLALCAAPSALAQAAAVNQSSAEADLRLDRLIVTGSPEAAAQLGGSATYLDDKLLQIQADADISRVLRAVPGVNIQEEDGFGLRPNIGLRGSGISRSSKITLMEDGILIAPAPYAEPSAYYFPHIGRMAAVEVVKGPGAVKYGPRTQGGSINLISTPIPEEAAGFVRLEAGDFDTRRAHAWAGGQTMLNGLVLGGLIEGFWDRSAGFKTLPGGQDTGYDIADYVAKIALSDPQAAFPWSLQIKAQRSDEVSDETYLGLTEADFAADPYQRYASTAGDRMDATHEELSARFTMDFETFDITLVAYRTEFYRDWFKIDKVDVNGSIANSGGAGTGLTAIAENPGAHAAALAILKGGSGFVSPDGAILLKHNNRGYVAEGLQGVLAFDVSTGQARHAIEVGLRFHKDEMDRFQWYDRFRIDNDTLVLTGSDTPGTESNRIDRAEALAFYIEDRISFGRWTLTPGVRYEAITLTRDEFGTSDPNRTGSRFSQRENKVEALIPSLSLTYDINADWIGFAGVHRGFSPPAPGTTDQAPEDAVNWEIGARYAKGVTRAEAVLFFNDYENLVGTCTASTGGGCIIGDQFDAGRARVRGLELSAGSDLSDRFSLPVGLPVRLAYTWTDGEFSNAFVSGYEPWGNVTAGDQLPYVPEHQWSLAFGVEAANWGSEASLNWVDETRQRAGQGPIPASSRIDARTLLDLTAWWQAFDKVRLTARVKNVTDETYIAGRNPSGARPGLPRQVLFGLEARF
jgi:Fe(3+) dicitrate transport protein